MSEEVRVRTDPSTEGGITGVNTMLNFGVYTGMHAPGFCLVYTKERDHAISQKNECVLRNLPGNSSQHISVQWQLNLYSACLKSALHPGIFHFMSNIDQLGQFMSHAFVGLAGKYL